MKQTLTLNRIGDITLLDTSKNQCRAEGHRNYNYHVIISASPELDVMGFLVDHVDVDKAVQDAVSRSNSCENLCMCIGTGVKRMLSARGIRAESIKVILKAVPSPKAWMEYEVVG